MQCWQGGHNVTIPIFFLSYNQWFWNKFNYNSYEIIKKKIINWSTCIYDKLMIPQYIFFTLFFIAIHCVVHIKYIDRSQAFQFYLTCTCLPHTHTLLFIYNMLKHSTDQPSISNFDSHIIEFKTCWIANNNNLFSLSHTLRHCSHSLSKRYTLFTQFQFQHFGANFI